MDDIFGLKFHLSQVCKLYIKNTRFLKIAPCAKNAKFVTDFLILKANPPFLLSKPVDWQMTLRIEIFF